MIYALIALALFTVIGLALNFILTVGMGRVVTSEYKMAMAKLQKQIDDKGRPR